MLNQHCVYSIDSLSVFGLSSCDVSAMTQDTTGSYYNVYDKVPTVSQNPCIGHLLQLMLKHGFGECSAVEDVLAAIRGLSNTLRGSSKRLEVLKIEMDKLNLKFLKPKIDGATR